MAGGLILGKIAKTATSTVNALYACYGGTISATAIGGIIVGIFMQSMKHFWLYSIFISINLFSGVVLMEGNPLEADGMILQYIFVGILKSLSMLLLFTIVFSWINNLFVYSYFKKRGYEFVEVSFFPFLVIKEDRRKKIVISFSINTLVQWHTIVSCKTIGSDIEVKKYVRDWRTCKQNIFIAYKVLLIGFVAIALISVPTCVFLCSGWLALYSLYTMPGANTMQEGLLVTGMQEQNIYCLFMNADLEHFDKTVLYRLIQDHYWQGQIDTINEKLFLNQLLVDSIYDDKNYLTEKVEHFLEEKYLFCNSNQLKSYVVVNARTFFLYYAYLLTVKKVDKAIQDIIVNNVNLLEEYYENISFYGKLFRRAQKKELFSPKYRVKYYVEKIDYVYAYIVESCLYNVI